MLRIRVVGSLFLLLFLANLAGCGGPKPAEPATNPAPPPTVAPGLNPTPTPSTQPAPGPKPRAELYTLDTEKHQFPTTPVAGRLKGTPFTPDRVELEGHKLTLRVGNDFFADQEIALSLDKQAKLAEGFKLVVKSSQKWSDRVAPPTLFVSHRKGKSGLPDTQFINDGYAMTLELGKLEKGKVPGKLFLCLADSEKSFLAGTFTAQRKRALSEPPGEEEVPFIQGEVSPRLKENQSLKVGYAGLIGGKVLSNMAGAEAQGNGGGVVRSTSFAPRDATLELDGFRPRYDFTNLPPGRYLIYAKIENGPAVWEWVDVAEGDRLTKDLKLNDEKLGVVEVKAANNVQKVRLRPTDFGVPPGSEQLTFHLEFSLAYEAEVKDGVAMFPRVQEGKYRIEEGNMRAEVEVVRGKTVIVELKK